VPDSRKEVNKVKKVTGSKKHLRPGAKQQHAKCRERESARSERAREVSMTVRAVLMIWEIVWTLVREHVSRGTGPGPLL
jgi:hypothetical protein